MGVVEMLGSVALADKVVVVASEPNVRPSISLTTSSKRLRPPNEPAALQLDAI